MERICIHSLIDMYIAIGLAGSILILADQHVDPATSNMLIKQEPLKAITCLRNNQIAIRQLPDSYSHS